MIVLAPVMIAIFVVIGGEVVLHLWNWLLPALFGWRQITFWQAVGLLALCRILFGGVSGRGFHRSNYRRRMARALGPDDARGTRKVSTGNALALRRL